MGSPTLLAYRDDIGPDTRVEWFRMALAEAGYPDVFVKWIPGENSIGVSYDGAPYAVLWQASFLAYPANTPCWGCFMDPGESVGQRCIASDCSHPEGPARPPRHLLLPRPLRMPHRDRRPRDLTHHLASP